jgi:hypothetical protein
VRSGHALEVNAFSVRQKLELSWFVRPYGLKDNVSVRLSLQLLDIVKREIATSWGGNNFGKFQVRAWSRQE